LKQTKSTGHIIRLAALLLTVFLAAVALFWLCYQHDNKYTARGAQAMSGVLMLDSDKLERRPIIYLVRGWQIYRGKLLAPQDFLNNAPTPDETVFIGQYGGFEGHITEGAKRNPHGSSTYRLNIALPPETRSYMLELPEIYSAYKLYINGTLMAEMGDITSEHYRPETGNSFVVVQASGRMEILVAVTDYSHFYSGMVYPPAFGEPGAVTRLLNTRMNLRAVADAVALCVGLLYLCLWLLTGKENTKRRSRSLPLYYAAMCLCFVLYTCYPVVKTMFTGGMGWYVAENFAYCAMFLFVMLIQKRLTAVNEKWFRPFEAFAVFVCCWSLIVPFIMGDSINLMMAYSWLIDLYAWVSALFLTVSAAYGVRHGVARSEAMLAGVTVFDAALIMDRLLPMFEPIRAGWFNELAGFVLVLLTGIVMAMDVARQYRLRQAMENRAEIVSKMLDVQRVYYPTLLEKEEEIKAARHDLRHHINTIRQLVSQGGVEKLTAYLDAFEERQVKPSRDTYCEHYITNMLLQMYAGLAIQQNTSFHAKASLPERIPVNDIDLCVILSNILENALEASARITENGRDISVHIGCELDMLGIMVKNCFDGNLRVENGRFLSAKQADREGVGLASVRAVCESYGGSADFYTDENKVFHSEVILPVKPETDASIQTAEVKA
jgi:signal transduction histidine kinase